jgi:hypothetical protein
MHALSSWLSTCTESLIHLDDSNGKFKLYVVEYEIMALQNSPHQKFIMP